MEIVQLIEGYFPNRPVILTSRLNPETHPTSSFEEGIRWWRLNWEHFEEVGFEPLMFLVMIFSTLLVLLAVLAGSRALWVINRLLLEKLRKVKGQLVPKKWTCDSWSLRAAVCNIATTMDSMEQITENALPQIMPAQSAKSVAVISLFLEAMMPQEADLVQAVEDLAGKPRQVAKRSLGRDTPRGEVWVKAMLSYGPVLVELLEHFDQEISTSLIGRWKTPEEHGALSDVSSWTARFTVLTDSTLQAARTAGKKESDELRLKLVRAFENIRTSWKQTLLVEMAGQAEHDVAAAEAAIGAFTICVDALAILKAPVTLDKTEWIMLTTCKIRSFTARLQESIRAISDKAVQWDQVPSIETMVSSLGTTFEQWNSNVFGLKTCHFQTLLKAIARAEETLVLNSTALEGYLSIKIDHVVATFQSLASRIEHSILATPLALDAHGFALSTRIRSLTSAVQAIQGVKGQQLQATRLIQLISNEPIIDYLVTLPESYKLALLEQSGAMCELAIALKSIGPADEDSDIPDEDMGLEATLQKALQALLVSLNCEKDVSDSELKELIRLRRSAKALLELPGDQALKASLEAIVLGEQRVGRQVAELIEDLNSSDAHVREDALRGLTRHLDVSSTQSKPAEIQCIITDCDDCKELGSKLGLETALSALKDSCENVQTGALEALGKFLRKITKRIKFWMASLTSQGDRNIQNEQSELRQEVLAAQRIFKEVLRWLRDIPEHIGQQEQLHSQMHQAATEFFEVFSDAMGCFAEAVALCASPQVIEEDICAIMKSSAACLREVKDLTCLSSFDKHAKLALIKVNAGIIQLCEDRHAISELGENLKDLDVDVRWDSAVALCKLGISAEFALPVLVEMLRVGLTSSPEAMGASTPACAKAKESIEVLCSLRGSDVSNEAMDASVLLLFWQLSLDKHLNLRRIGLEALEKLGTSALPLLLGYLEFGNREQQTAASIAIWRISQSASIGASMAVARFIEDILLGNGLGTSHPASQIANSRNLMLDLPSPWTLMAGAAIFVMCSSQHPLSELLNQPHAIVRCFNHTQWGFHCCSEWTLRLPRQRREQSLLNTKCEWFKKPWRDKLRCFQWKQGENHREQFEQVLGLDEEQRLCTALQGFQLVTRFEVVPRSDLCDPTLASVFASFGLKVYRKEVQPGQPGQLVFASKRSRPRLVNVEAIERVVHRGFFPERFHLVSPVVPVVRPWGFLIDFVVVTLQIAFCILMVAFPLVLMLVHHLAEVPFGRSSPLDGISEVHFGSRLPELTQTLLLSSPALTLVTATSSAALFASLIFAYVTEVLPLAPLPILQAVLRDTKITQANTILRQNLMWTWVPFKTRRLLRCCRCLGVILHMLMKGIAWFAFFFLFAEITGCLALFCFWLAFGCVVDPESYIPLVSVAGSFVFAIIARIRNLMNWRQSLAASIHEILQALIWVSLIQRMNIPALAANASYQRLLQGNASNNDIFDLLAEGQQTQQTLRTSRVRYFLAPIVDQKAFAMLINDIASLQARVVLGVRFLDLKAPVVSFCIPR